MSKLKHLLRKLHIGNDHQHHHNHSHTNLPVPNPPTSLPSPSVSGGPASTSVAMSQPRAVDLDDRTVTDYVQTPLVQDDATNNHPVDFNFFEEEFQVQLALALSASDPETSKDTESDQIKAVKQLSLGRQLSVADNSEFQSRKYWNYNVVHYDEKVVDGFYDVYAISSNLVSHGEMPLLVDLQASPISDNVDNEVLLVNRTDDPQLQYLENKAQAISVECKVWGHELFLNALIQRIADLVVDQMGGPVGDADEMMKRCRVTSNELRNSLNTVILPLGRVDVGLSRHRSLLFKVLADRINLPCMLVKGSLYTGTDDGAVNLIKIDDGSEYIIDLMGAPGTLIPAEAPSSLLLNSALGAGGFSGSSGSTNKLSLVLHKVARAQEVLPDVDEIPKAQRSSLEEAIPVGFQPKHHSDNNKAEKSEHKFEKLVPSEYMPTEASPFSVEGSLLAQEQKVKSVSKYVISAAKNPEFAQKLHAVLLESGASPPPDLFSDIASDIVSEQKLFEQVQPEKGGNVELRTSCNSNKYWSNNELSLLPPSGVHPLDVFGCDDTLKHTVEESTGHQLEPVQHLVNYALCSESKNEGLGLAAIEANRVSPNESPGAAIIPGIANASEANTSKMDGGASYQKISEEYSLPTVFDSSNGMVGYSGDILNHRGIGKGSAISMEPVKWSLATFNDYAVCLNPVLVEEISPMLGEVAEWEILWEDLQIGDRIGIGSYGEVYHADWNGTEVAVKKFLVQDISVDVLVQFKCEAEMMLRLRHPNVVLFMGAVTRPPNLSILTEFLPRGSLYKLLHRSSVQIDEKRRMKMALDVAKGMNYLHTMHPTIVHRDLKSPNLLVDKNWVVKVADFGMSRMKHHTFLSSKSTAGTPEWMAPEVLRNEPSNEKCDVYSFGVILWELATLLVPWTGLNPMQVVGAVGFQHRRLEIPEEVDPIVAGIILDCWENDPNLRPSFSELISRLRGLKRLVVWSN
ncbi:hypothetical protein Nepgr_008794 [Nepenthes gracilis]|uniref:non-specific serine/threonine protein kinase n=1 Tax=Nepenthes gracilis TaxID=150966 RepID=A0AAD3SA48_NEPGR|nr:hypothetical protein Nepgr_008794 [Nepenthes gracilis]